MGVPNNKSILRSPLFYSVLLIIAFFLAGSVKLIYEDLTEGRVRSALILLPNGEAATAELRPNRGPTDAAFTWFLYIRQNDTVLFRGKDVHQDGYWEKAETCFPARTTRLEQRCLVSPDAVPILTQALDAILK